MILRALTNGSVTGTGNVSLSGSLFGGALVTADGTNNATVTVQLNDSAGKTVFKIVTKTPGLFAAPISGEGASVLYYSVSGTGGAAQLYEAIA